MKQTDRGLVRTSRHTCKGKVLAEMNRGVARGVLLALMALMAAHAPGNNADHLPLRPGVMLCTRFLPWFGLPHVAMDGARFDVACPGSSQAWA